VNTQVFLAIIVVALILVLCLRVSHAVSIGIVPRPLTISRDIKLLTRLKYTYFFVLLEATWKTLIVTMGVALNPTKNLRRSRTAEHVESIQISHRQFKILLAVAVASRPMLGVEIHRKARVPIGEVYTLLQKLVGLNLLAYDRGTATYVLASEFEPVIREELSNDLFQTKQRLQLVTRRAPALLSTLNEQTTKETTTRKPTGSQRQARA
jgi:hypothetical protein